MLLNINRQGRAQAIFGDCPKSKHLRLRANPRISESSTIGCKTVHLMPHLYIYFLLERPLILAVLTLFIKPGKKQTEDYITGKFG